MVEPADTDSSIKVGYHYFLSQRRSCLVVWNCCICWFVLPVRHPLALIRMVVYNVGHIAQLMGQSDTIIPRFDPCAAPLYTGYDIASSVCDQPVRSTSYTHILLGRQAGAAGCENN